jgi:signal transduction histidine kinase
VIKSALVIAGTTVAVGSLLVAALRLLPRLRWQLAGLAALAVCLPLAVVLLSGWVMFHMGADVKILAVSAASATAAVLAGLWLAHSIVRSIDRVRDASAALARGQLNARAPEGGPLEVAELAASFNDMAANLEQLFDARRELVAWASHDLRTPLANMQAILEACEDGMMDAQESLPTLRAQVANLSKLVDDLFELARIDAGALTLELQEAPLAPIVASCLRGIEAEARLRGIGIQAHLEDSVIARFAPHEVERVVANLLTNALRHTPTDGSIAVRVAPVNGAVRVTVEDSGAGLEEETQRRMFDRFWRGDPARATRGAGLGLAIAQGLVRAHGGDIWAENRPGGGASISFTLPTGESAAPVGGAA